MKSISLILLLSFLLLCCKNEAKPKSESQTIHSFDWLIGDWQRKNNDDGDRTFETWKKESDHFYKGFGYTLRNQDTVSYEYMFLKYQDNNWTFEVEHDNSSPTIFKINEINTKQFACVNPENEFPKKIEYRLKRNNLKAIISDDKQKILFDFIPLSM